MIFAHGPLWSEWHHILDFWPALVAGGSAFFAYLRLRFAGKKNPSAHDVGHEIDHQADHSHDEEGHSHG